MAGQETEQFPLRMQKPTHKILKVLCAQEGLTMNGVINQAIDQWLATYRKKKAEEFLEQETKATEEAERQRQVLEAEAQKKREKIAKETPEQKEAALRTLQAGSKKAKKS